MGGSRIVKVVIQLYFRIIMLSTFCEQTSLRLVAKVREIVPRFIGVVVVVVVVVVIEVEVGAVAGVGGDRVERELVQGRSVGPLELRPSLLRFPVPLHPILLVVGGGGGGGTGGGGGSFLGEVGIGEGRAFINVLDEIPQDVCVRRNAIEHQRRSKYVGEFCIHRHHF